MKFSVGKPPVREVPTIAFWVELSEGGKIYLRAKHSWDSSDQLLAIFNTDGTVELRNIYSANLCASFGIKPDTTLLPALKIEDPKVIEGLSKIEIRHGPADAQTGRRSPCISAALATIRENFSSVRGPVEFTQPQWLYDDAAVMHFQEGGEQYVVTIEKFRPPLVAPRGDE